MNKKLLLVFFSPFLLAQAPDGYYSNTENLKGYQLKNQLTNILRKSHISRDYADLINKYYSSTDLDQYYDHGKENTTFLLDIYTEIINGPEIEYTTKSVISNGSSEGQGINREHMVPQSTFNGLYPMYSDLFTVIPADAYINQRRSNYPYATVGNNTSYVFKNGGKIGKAVIEGHSYTGSAYEPIDEFKGDVARSLLYYVVRYAEKLPFLRYDYSMSGQGDVNPMDGSIDRGYDAAYIKMLKKWHELDPVSQREIDRNNEVFKIQGNRNPFIDNPQWVNVIWNDEIDGIAPQPPQNFKVSVGAHYAKLTWDMNPKALGYKVFLGSNLEVITHDNTAYIDRLVPGREYTFKIVAYDGDFIDSQSISASATTLLQDEFASNLIISKYIEGSGNNKAIEIANRTGHPVNLNNYRFGSSLSSTNTGMYEHIDLEGTINHNETIVIMHTESNLTCLNPKEADIVTDAPSIKYSGWNYVELAYVDNVVDAIGIKGTNNSSIMQNVSLYRKLDTVLNPSANYNATEWERYSSNYCDGLRKTLSTSNVNVKDPIKIYPNPTSDKFFVSKDFTNEINIFDITGKLVLKMNNIRGGESIDIQNLSTGVYFVLIDGQSFKLVKK